MKRTSGSSDLSDLSDLYDNAPMFSIGHLIF